MRKKDKRSPKVLAEPTTHLGQVACLKESNLDLVTSLLQACFLLTIMKCFVISHTTETCEIMRGVRHTDALLVYSSKVFDDIPQDCQYTILDHASSESNAN